MSEPTFTDEEQQLHRDLFINECRQKAWGARCHADWVAKGLDTIMAEYEKLQAEDRGLEAEIKGLETAADYHTVENRNKRKGLQERRNAIAKAMQQLGANMQQGQKALQGLYQSGETNRQLAKHAEGGWQEVEVSTPGEQVGQ
jgi:chromosome segregation ATPase